MEIPSWQLDTELDLREFWAKDINLRVVVITEAMRQNDIIQK